MGTPSFQQAQNETTIGGNGKIPTVTRALLNKEELATLASGPRRDLGWLLRLPEEQFERLARAAHLALQAGAGIITLEAAKDGWRAGLRPRESGDSSCHPALIGKDGDFGDLKSALKKAGCDVKDVNFADRRGPMPSLNGALLQANA